MRGTGRWIGAALAAVAITACGVSDRKVALKQDANSVMTMGQGGSGGTLGAHDRTSGIAGAAGMAGDGKIGSACSSDTDCEQGICTGSASDDERYCAPPCDSSADCGSLAATSYTLVVPETVTPQGGSPTPNEWGTTVLERGVACLEFHDHPGKGYCAFGCGPFQAMTADQKCYCLPGYTLDATKTRCEFAPDDIQCTIFSFQPDEAKEYLANHGIQVANPKCDACNSNMDFTNTLECHTGVFGCELNNVGFKGRCAEFLSVDQLNQCIADKTNFNCDCADGCIDTCGGDCVDIVDTCCHCTGGATAPAPTCNQGANGMGSGGASASGSGGTGGAAGMGGGTGGTTGGAVTDGGAAGGTAGATADAGAAGSSGGAAGGSN